MVRADVRDTSALRALFLNVQPDVVVHLAAKTGTRLSFVDRAAFRDVNINGTTSVLSAAEAIGGPHVILMSCGSVYGNVTRAVRETDPARPNSPYAVSKYAAEQVAQQWSQRTGTPVTTLRVFSVYGPRQRPDMAFRQLAARLLRGEAPILYGNPVRDWVHVDDVIRALMAAIRRPHAAGVFNIASGNHYRLSQVIPLLARALDVPVISPELKPATPGSATQRTADITRAAQSLHWVPEVSLRRGLHSFSAWLGERDPVLASAMEPTPLPTSPRAYRVDTSHVVS